MATINGSMSPDSIAPPSPSPSPSATSRRASAMGERFDHHLDRAMESRPHEQSRDERDAAHDHLTEARPSELTARAAAARGDRHRVVRSNARRADDRPMSRQPLERQTAASAGSGTVVDRDGAERARADEPVESVSPPAELHTAPMTPPVAIDPLDALPPTVVPALVPTVALAPLAQHTDAGGESAPDAVDSIGGIGDANVAPAAAPALAVTVEGSVGTAPSSVPDHSAAVSGIAPPATAPPTSTTAASIDAVTEAPVDSPLPTVGSAPAPDDTAAPSSARSPNREAPKSETTVGNARGVDVADSTPPVAPTRTVADVVHQPVAGTPTVQAAAALGAVVVDATHRGSQIARTSRVSPGAAGSGLTNVAAAVTGAASAPALDTATAASVTAPADEPTSSAAGTSTTAFAAAMADADSAGTSTVRSAIGDGSAADDVAAELGTGARRVDARGLPVSVPSLSMDLSDEGLGPLTLQAMAGGGVVNLKLTAGDRAVGDMLARAGGELRRDLEAGGTNVGTLDIGHSDDGRAGADHAGRHQSNHASTGPNDRRTAADHATVSARAARPPYIRPTPPPSPIRSATVADGVDVRI
jgi:hypothetical protein